MSGTLTLATLRNLTAADRGRIEEISRAVGLFRQDEIPVALEVFVGAVAGSPDYIARGAEHDGRLAGWICWGPTPCTLGTYDLYWMAVDPAVHGAGVGTALIHSLAVTEKRGATGTGAAAGSTGTATRKSEATPKNESRAIAGATAS